MTRLFINDADNNGDSLASISAESSFKRD